MNSKIIIVDENDQVIGHKDRDALFQEDIYRVSVLWVINSQGDVLLAQRALTKSHDPGKWGPAVAGTLEEGEDYLTNIYKEAKEELGLKDFTAQILSKERVAGEYNYFVQRYLAIVDKPEKDFTVNQDEVAEIKWFKKEELRQKLQEDPNQFLKTTKKWLEVLINSN
jgi:isopentenyl-diphosphate delta-isomerase